MYEIEQKFCVTDVADLVDRLTHRGAIAMPAEDHADTYYNHPSRDFAETREALRVRRVDGTPMVTYKGTKLPGDVKARQELEYRLDPGDADGSQTETLWQLLGFRKVRTVRKVRQPYRWPSQDSGSNIATPMVVIDQVAGLGTFAEIELIAADESGVPSAREQILALAADLGLDQVESRSYLRMSLELVDGP